MEVTFTSPVSKGISLGITSADGTSSSSVFAVPEGARKFILNSAGKSHGTFQLTLFENGTPLENRKFLR